MTYTVVPTQDVLGTFCKERDEQYLFTVVNCHGTIMAISPILKTNRIHKYIHNSLINIKLFFIGAVTITINTHIIGTKNTT